MTGLIGKKELMEENLSEPGTSIARVVFSPTLKDIRFTLFL